MSTLAPIIITIGVCLAIVVIARLIVTAIRIRRDE